MNRRPTKTYTQSGGALSGDYSNAIRQFKPMDNTDASWRIYTKYTQTQNWGMENIMSDLFGNTISSARYIYDEEGDN